MKGQFYPNWFINKKVKEYGREFNKVIILLLILSSISVVNICNDWRSIKNSKEEIRSHRKDLVTEDNSFKLIEKFNFVYEKIYEIKDFIKIMEINEDTIYLEIFAQDIKDYGAIVKIIEKNFNIEEISPLKLENEKSYFMVRMKDNEV